MATALMGKEGQEEEGSLIERGAGCEAGLDFLSNRSGR